MTYAEFLALFLVIPIVCLGFALRGRFHKRHRLTCLVICGLAFLYTAPWDNYAAAKRLWTFDPHFAPPSHFFFFLPWEEYAFYGLQGILISLLLVLLARRLPPDGSERADL